MSEWIEKRLGDIIKLTKGISYSSEDYSDAAEGTIFITLKCFAKNGGFSKRGIKYYNGGVPETLFLKSGDLLIANTDITRDGDIVGCPVYVPDLGEELPITMSMDVSRLDFLPNSNTDKHFLYYLMMTREVRNFMKGHSSGSTVLHLKTSAVPEIKIRIPADPAEQARIAHILGTVDAAIEQTEALIAKYGRIRTGLMQDLLSSQLVKLSMLPLGQLADVVSGITLGKKHEGPDIVERPYLRVANVQDGFLSLTDVTNIRIPKSQVERYELRDGDVLMNEGGDFDKLGRGTVWRNEIAGCLHQNHVFRVRCNQAVLLPEYLALVSASPYGKRFFVLNSKQSTNLASINSTQLKGFPIPLPNIGEQQRLVEIFTKKTAVLKTHQQQLLKLQTLKKGLMQDLLSGPEKNR